MNFLPDNYTAPIMRIQKANYEVLDPVISRDFFLAWNFLSDLDLYYSDFKLWFFYKVFPDIATGRRKILVKTMNEKVIAVAILKKYIEESKICTFRVSRDIKGNGVGTELMLESLEWLQCSKPLITVNEEHASEFEAFLRKFHFQKTTIINGLYRPKKKEIIYNAPTSLHGGKRGCYNALLTTIKVNSVPTKTKDTITLVS